MLQRFLVLPMVLMVLLGWSPGAAAQNSAAVTGPAEYVFASPGGTDLKAYVFTPKAQGRSGKRAGIVIFHGGGWSEGEPSWAFGRASHFAERGMVAVAAPYRLSDGKTIILQGSTDSVTPLPGVKRFCDLMIAAGNRCELDVYEGFGHLFTPAGISDSGQPKPDPATRADALAKAEQFLKSLGYLE
jgi:acetyl esterase/lipase